MQVAMIFKVLFNNIFWWIRMHLAMVFLPNGMKKNIRELLADGYTILPKYISNKDLDHLDRACDRALDEVVGVDGPPNVVKRIPGSIRITNLNDKYFDFDYFRKNLRFLVLSFLVSNRFGWPSVMYAVTHDGSFNHPAVPGKTEKPFANQWHFDSPFHHFKAIIFMSEIEAVENGPTIVIPGSVRLNWKSIKLYCQRTLGREKNIDGTSFAAQEFDENFWEKEISKKGGKPLLCQRGDVVLFDTRIIHKASELSKGCRRLLWFYY